MRKKFSIALLVSFSVLLIGCGGDKPEVTKEEQATFQNPVKERPAGASMGGGTQTPPPAGEGK